MASFTTYAFDQATVSLGAIIVPTDAFAPGDDAISIEQNNDLFTIQVGAGGGVSRAKSADRSAKVTLKLQATHPINLALTTLHAADEATSAGVVPVFIRSGQSTHIAEKAWIMRSPQAAYGAGAGTREWVLECASMVSIHGGETE